MINIQHMKEIEKHSTHEKHSTYYTSIQPFENIQPQKVIQRFQAIITGDIFCSNSFLGDTYFFGI